MKAPLPENEAARLEALRRYEVLDTDPDELLDALTRLAAYICGTPIAVISLVDSDRQWFKSRMGMMAEETARDISFCQYAILQPGPFIVRDALSDERFRTSPLVTSDPYIRFCAGSPLITDEGLKIGTLCVIDRVPKDLDPEQIAALRILSHLVMTQIDQRRTIDSLTRSLDEQKLRTTELEERLSRREKNKDETIDGN